ncbi:hypothetical protein C8Q76DRAFT_710508 [Earliella scabrosa]|nr:hypothetical protein C8Q76DRAFT_710508 [Earliella scabrosa]
MSESNIVTVDNEEYDRIRYLSPESDSTFFWLPSTPVNAADVWDGSVQVATDAGLSAVFSFTGSQVSVYGRVEPAANGGQQPLSLYSVGSQKLQAYIPDDVTSPIDNVAFFNSTILPYGQYTLLINVSRVDSGTPYMLDYIRYNISNPDLGNSGPPPSTTVSNDPSASGPSSPPSTSASSSSAPVGAIVGGVLGGIALVAGLVFAFLCYRIRKRRALSPSDDPNIPPTSRITPYVLPVNANSQGHFGGAPFDAPSPSLMRQIGTGSAYSLVPTSLPGEASPRPSKAALARAAGPSYGDLGSGDSAHDLAVGPTAASTAGTMSASGSSASAHSRTTPDPQPHAYGYTNHPPQSHSTLPSLPSFPAASPSRGGKRHRPPKNARSPPHVSSSSPSPPASAPLPQDSGLRFQPGLTPSNVAPVLPAGAAPIRSAATASEVARADIPPAYTPD